MSTCHLLLPDLFLPQKMAASAYAGLDMPVLEMMLARAEQESMLADTMETWLCDMFGVTGQAIAPVTLLADGMQPGNAYWLRADPVHVEMLREQMILHPEVSLNAGEASQLCASLNEHFESDGLCFFAPHPQRWYIRLDSAPNMSTHSPAQVAGQNVLAHLPQGPDALRWHAVFNEIQMLFHEHAVNQAREKRGDRPVNSVWLWGGGRIPEQLSQPFYRVVGDSDLTAAFAQVSGIGSGPLPGGPDFLIEDNHGDVLVVWEGLRRALQQGDLNAWRDSLQRLEHDCAMPLWHALCAGHIEQLILNVPAPGGARRFMLRHGAKWKLWRRPKPLNHYALV